jgi:hypothetical protein
MTTYIIVTEDGDVFKSSDEDQLNKWLESNSLVINPATLQCVEGDAADMDGPWEDIDDAPSIEDPADEEEGN